MLATSWSDMFSLRIRVISIVAFSVFTSVSLRDSSPLRTRLIDCITTVAATCHERKPFAIERILCVCFSLAAVLSFTAFVRSFVVFVAFLPASVTLLSCFAWFFSAFVCAFMDFAEAFRAFARALSCAVRSLLGFMLLNEFARDFICPLRAFICVLAFWVFTVTSSFICAILSLAVGF